MSLFTALNVALTSVSSLNGATRVVSDNVANATNDEYNKRTAQFINLEFGGVNIASIVRAVNQGLQRDLFQQTTAAAADGTLDALYQQIEQLIGTFDSETPLVDEIERLRSAFKALEATPESDAAEREILLAADAIVNELTRLSDGLDLIENQVLFDIENLVDETNDVLAEIDRLNNQIVLQKAIGQPTATLENLRDAQIAKLTEITEIRTFERADGSLGVYSASGLALVDATAATFTWSEATRSLTLSGSVSTDLVTGGQLSDGKLAVLTNFVRTDSAGISSANIGDATLQKLRNQLDEVAFALADDSTARTSGTTFVRGSNDLVGDGILTAGNDLDFFIGGASLGNITVPASMSTTDLVTAINSINQIRARVDGHGNLQILSDGGDFTISGTAAAELGLTTSPVSADTEDTLMYAYKAEHAAGTVPLTTATTLNGFNGIAAGDEFSFNNAALGRAVTYTVGATDTVQNLLDFINGQVGMYARIGDGNVLEITSTEGSLTLTEVTNTPLTNLGFTVNGTAAAISGTAGSNESNDLFVAEGGTTPTDVTWTNFAVATTLLAGTSDIKISNRSEIMDAMNSSNRSMSGSGINITSTDYTGLIAGVFAEVSQTAGQASNKAENSEILRSGLEQSLRDEVGVDIDEEMATLAILQNSFAATARVIDAINQMLQSLELAGR